MDQALSLARANLEQARRSVQDPRPAPPEGRTLAYALGAVAEESAAKGAAPVRFNATGRERPPPSRVESARYRVAQEAVPSAMQHTAARSNRLELLAQPAQVQLLVVDDRRGFVVSAIHAGRYGPAGINERVHILGVKVNLQSSPGQGARSEAVVQLGEGHG